MNGITGASGFIGSKLLAKLQHSIAIPHDTIHSRTYQDYERLFFLSTYGNMAHHKDHKKMVTANVSDLAFVLDNFFDGWFCYMSSSSVRLPVQTSYSRTKRAGEEIILALPELKSCIVRPYSVTGVGEQKEHLIPTLIRSCFEGTEMGLVPYATHDFIDVEDVVDALVRMSNDGATGIYEFGNGFAIDNDEVRLLVEEVTGRKVNFKYGGVMREYDNESWCCKSRNDYWQPTKTLRQSITEMVEEYKNKMKI